MAMTLHDELAAVRRALAELDRTLHPLRARPASRRLVQRLDGDLRRMQEDVDDLAAEERSRSGVLVPAARDFAPIPVPPRDLETAYDPQCEDEGLAGWRTAADAPSPVTDRRR
jgi:hypothetical protein